MHGQRVVVGQRLTQGSAGIFLGWGDVDWQFYGRQLADMKGSVKFGEHDAIGLEGFIAYCSLCGWALALACAKSGDPAMIAGYCGNLAALDEAALPNQISTHVTGLLQAEARNSVASGLCIRHSPPELSRPSLSCRQWGS